MLGLLLAQERGGGQTDTDTDRLIDSIGRLDEKKEISNIKVLNLYKEIQK